MTTTPHSPAEAPTDLLSLIEALRDLPGLSPLDRAVRSVELMGVAKSVLAAARAEAFLDAINDGMGVTAIARELGIQRSKVNDAIAAQRGRDRVTPKH